MDTVKLNFHQITLEDKKWMDDRFAEEGQNACEYSFANNYLWRKVFQVEVAQLYGCALIRFREGDKLCYAWPIGAGDKKTAVDELLSFSHQNKTQLTLVALLEENRRRLTEWFPRQFLIRSNRAAYDYIYSREKLATLAGKKLHGKRNHIARFREEGDWSYEPMTPDNLEACRSMTDTWMRMRKEKWNADMEEEVLVLCEAFDHMWELGLTGGVLRREGEVVAFCIGEPLNRETFVVHFEKAFPDMQGAYPMINQQFVLHACQEYTFVNREDDAGNPGLRRAKLSYYPEILLKKYTAEESAVVFADPVEDAAGIRRLWQTCFGDGEAYIDFYLTRRMDWETMLVIYEDGIPVSMASFLPAEYVTGGEYIPAWYVYAVATLPEYRGRGYAGEIIECAKRLFQGPLVLMPAEDSLVAFYERLGFVQSFGDSRAARLPSADARLALKAKLPPADADAALKEGRTGTGTGTETAKIVGLREVTPEEYLRTRDARLFCEGYVRWDEAAIRYAMDINRFLGGDAVGCISEDGRLTDVVMYHVSDGVLYVEESTFAGKLPEKVGQMLMEKTGTSRLQLQKFSGMIWCSDPAKYAEGGYLNLTLG
ncbi:MAG: GNAT family N-acetyltransferase [Roseburia sp.]